jgi:predicted  nucleic acid-binding Zn ribbon protein
MIAAKLTFQIKTDKSNGNNHEIRDLIEGYLSGFIKSGNIWGDYIISNNGSNFFAYVYLSHPTSIIDKYLTKYSIEDRNKLQEFLSETPKCEILESNVNNSIPDWKNENFLYLFTHAFDFTSPVCLGSTGDPLPIIFLPLSDLDRERAKFWASSYKDHDRIWFDSGELEIPSYKQIADPRSGLSREGRELCSIIEKKTGMPTYYYLNRYWGRRKGESKRPCPICGKQWRSQGKRPDNEEFSNFTFQCKPCRLVSHDADSFEDERHARIGEFKALKSEKNK